MATKTHRKAKSGTKKTRHDKKQARKTAKGRQKHKKHVQGEMQLPETRPVSFEDAVILNILNNSEQPTVSNEAFLFTSTLSSLTPEMQRLYYKAGMSIGRALYRSASNGKVYTVPEEPVPDLVRFFEKAGNEKITYDAFPDKVAVNIYGRKSPNLGARIHSFEAGIIAGFLSAANRMLINVAETSCSASGSEFCRFTTNPAKRMDTGVSPSLDGLAEYIPEHLSEAHKEIDGARVAMAYYSLLIPSLLAPEYSEQIKRIAEHIGYSMSAKLFNSLNAKPNSKKAMDSIASTIRLLNLGDPSIKSLRPFDMLISFDALASKRGFVDISMAFVNGMLANSVKSDLTATERNRNGSYVIEIKERS